MPSCAAEAPNYLTENKLVAWHIACIKINNYRHISSSLDILLCVFDVYCWMTPKVRKLLQEREGLPDDAQVPAPHRAQYPAFKKKFAPVTLVKATIPGPHPVLHNGYA